MCTFICSKDSGERDEDSGLIIERILILVRNILHVPADDHDAWRPDNDASVHDQVNNKKIHAALLKFKYVYSSLPDVQRTIFFVIWYVYNNISMA